MAKKKLALGKMRRTRTKQRKVNDGSNFPVGEATSESALTGSSASALPIEGPVDESQPADATSASGQSSEQKAPTDQMALLPQGEVRLSEASPGPPSRSGEEPSHPSEDDKVSEGKMKGNVQEEVTEGVIVAGDNQSY